jgi:hypothetical protein
MSRPLSRGRIHPAKERRDVCATRGFAGFLFVIADSISPNLDFFLGDCSLDKSKGCATFPSGGAWHFDDGSLGNSVLDPVVSEAENTWTEPSSEQIAKVRQERKRRYRAIVLNVFGDESHDEKKQRVFAVGGLIGREEEWDALGVIWNERTGGKPFHAADCESDRGDYKGIEHHENLRLYADLARMLAKRTRLLGFGVAIDLVEYRRIFAGLPEDQPYYLCFHDVVKSFAQVGYLHVPREKVSFTFDRNLEREYNATVLYDYMVHLPDWKFRDYIGDTVSFADRRNVGIQAADLIAREAMKHLDNQIGPQLRLPRASIRVLGSSNRFKFNFYVEKSLLALEQMAKDLDLDTLRKNGESLLGFREWLLETKQADTIANRIRYIQYAKSPPAGESKF